MTRETPGQLTTNRWKDLAPRTLSAVLLVPVVLELVLFGSAWFQLLAAFLGIMIAKEFTEIAHQSDDLQFACHALGALVPVTLMSQMGMTTMLAVIVILALASNILLLRHKKPVTFWQRIGVLYVALPIVALMTVRGQGDDGLVATLLLLVMVWAADTFAYFFGRILGGPKLAPRLSPKKTWAGLLGAVFGAVTVVVAFVIFGWAQGIFALVLLAAGLAVLEQAGDIFESAFKRAHGIKDSGNLIPGHGGMLDRVDGLLAVFVGAAIVGAIHNGADPATGIIRW